MDDLITEYIEFLSGSKRPKTLDAYRWVLKDFEKYMDQCHVNFDTCTAKDVMGYVMTNKTSSAYRQFRLAILKTFFMKFYMNKIPVGVTTDELRYRLQRETEVREIGNIPEPRFDEPIKNKAIKLNKVQEILEYAKSHDTHAYHLFWVFFYFGMRKGEMLGISPTKHVMWRDNTISLTSDIVKTHNARDIYFDGYTKTVLIELLKKYGTKTRLINLKEYQVNDIFEKYDGVLGTHFHPHMCRHTFVTEMQKSVRGKVALSEEYVIKLLAGHHIKNDITARYTDYRDEAKKAMINHHYLNGLR